MEQIRVFATVVFVPIKFSEVNERWLLLSSPVCLRAGMDLLVPTGPRLSTVIVLYYNLFHISILQSYNDSIIFIVM